VMFNFPAELSAAGRLAAAQRIARQQADAHGVATEFSIHQPGKEGDERNFHCHLMMTTRRLTAKGLGEKVREWSDMKTGPRLTKELRAFIAATLNDQLRQEGKAEIVHVEHRSFADRGIGQRPTIHQGPKRTSILRKEHGRARQAWEREQRQAMAARHAKEIAALKVRQDFALQARYGQWTERQRAGEEAIRRELDAQRQADRAQQKTGIRPVFRTITFRAGREAFEQQTREGQHIEAARQKVEALRAEISAEQREFMTGQRQEQAALIDSHKQDVAKIQSAVEVRHQIDRGAERATRQAPSYEIERQHERTREQGRDIGRELSP
jgi:hypothetical protein